MGSPLDDIGKHCTFKLCKQKDYLPFQCTSCELYYCKEHAKPETHDCSPSKSEKKVLREKKCILDRCAECNNVEINPIICKECQYQFCVPHRDHEHHKSFKVQKSSEDIISELAQIGMSLDKQFNTDEERKAMRQVGNAEKLGITSIREGARHCDIEMINLNEEKKITKREDIDTDTDIISFEEMNLNWVLGYLKKIKQTKTIPRNIRNAIFNYISNLCDS